MPDEEKKPVVDKPLETPCENGRFIVAHAYSRCVQGHWHVLEDDDYECPDGVTRKYRVLDVDTGFPCTAKRPKPTSLFKPGLDTDCQSPRKIGEAIILECINGFWNEVTYDVYECVGQTLRRLLPSSKPPVPTTDSCEE